ncbi:MAG TPA: hypothetical protein VIK35_00410 [Verrucomicrobiae bacterium]
MFRRIKKFIHSFEMCYLGAMLGFSSAVFGQEDFHDGPAFDQFSLTLDSGRRTEAVGPFFYDEQKDSEKTRAIPPLLSYDADPATESKEFDLLYPLLTYESYGSEYRWQFFQLFAFSGGKNSLDSRAKRFTIFPLYFQQRSPDTNENYTALVPFYGHLKNRLFRDDIYFVMFPIYSETRKKDVVNDNYLYPFFNLRHGDGMHGWQLWPLVGEEHKVVTTTTNGFGDVSIVGGYDKFFALWPFCFKTDTGIGTDEREKSWGVLPFYMQTRSPLRDSTSALWPFFTWIDERGKKYREWQGPWPFVIFTRGEGKTTSRAWPLFSQSHNNEKESDSYLWPLYQFHRLHFDPLDQRRTRVMFYLYEDTVEKNTQTGAEKRRVDMWPFFTWHRDFDGNSRLQIFAPIEPVVPENSGIERNWSPLWSLWRAETNPKTGAGSQSLLWNLYRSDSTPDSKKISLLFGLFQYQSTGETNRLRLFYIPVMKTSGQEK